MAKLQKAVAATSDEQLAAQIESALAGAVASVQVLSAGDLLRRTPEADVIVFLDARGLNGEKAAAVARASRGGEGASVVVLSNNQSADAVLDSMRTGAVDHLALPLDPAELTESVQRIVRRGETNMPGSVTAVFSLKGGQGVTSVAVNLADHLRLLTQESCLLADLNLYMGHVLVNLDMKCAYTPFDLVRDLGRADDNLLFSSLAQHPRGFHVLGVSEKIADAGQIGGEDVGAMLRLLRQYVRHTVLDIPHDFSPQALAGLDAADRVLLVVQQDIPSLKSAQLALRVFADLDYDEGKVSILVNRRLERAEIEIADIESSLKRPVFAGIHNDYATLAALYNKGETVDMGAPAGRLNDEFAALASRLSGLPQPPRKRRRWRDLLPV